MDKWVTVIKPRRLTTENENGKSASLRYKPYKRNKSELGGQSDKPTPVLTSNILRNMRDQHNPITHSDITRRSDHISSMFAGHQHAEDRKHQSAYLQLRQVKMKEQFKELTPQAQAQTRAETGTGAGIGILTGTKVHINGFLQHTTDIELKRTLRSVGASILNSASTATHIITSQHLSASKTHAHISGAKRRVHVVKPEWVFESVKAGKRLSESNYKVLSEGASLRESSSRKSSSRETKTEQDSSPS